MGTLANWNFFNRNVQSGLTEGQFLNMASCCLCAGPPYLGVGGSAVLDADAEGTSVGDTVWPMGLSAQVGMNQQIALVPIPEIGSYKRYTVTGPSDGSFAIGRTLYHGPSLLRGMYAYYSAAANPDIVIEPLIDDGAANLLRNPHNYISDSPGYHNFWINMASSILSQPVGLLIFLLDVNQESYGAVYLEQVHPSAHGLSISPGQLVIAEQVSGMFARARPVKLANPIPLMSRLSKVEDRNDSGVTSIAGTARTIAGVQRIRTASGSNV